MTSGAGRSVSGRTEFCPFFAGANDEKAIAVVGDAHRMAVDSVHAVAPGAQVGITLSLQQVTADPGSGQTADAVEEFIRPSAVRYGAIARANGADA